MSQLTPIFDDSDLTYDYFVVGFDGDPIGYVNTHKPQRFRRRND